MVTRGQDAVRVAIVEDDADTRLLVRIATELDPRYDLVGEFETLRDAVTGLLRRPVDVVIVDRLEDGARCCELLAQLRITVGRARIVVVDPGDAVPAEPAMAAGADAFLEPTAFTRRCPAARLRPSRVRCLQASVPSQLRRDGPTSPVSVPVRSRGTGVAGGVSRGDGARSRPPARPGRGRVLPHPRRSLPGAPPRRRQ